MEVCDNGCIAKMTQGFQTGSGFETSVERTCSPAEAPDMDEQMEEFSEYMECENDLCNELQYSSTESILASCFLLLFVSML